MSVVISIATLIPSIFFGSVTETPAPIETPVVSIITVSEDGALSSFAG